MPISTNYPSNRRAYIITGPTSGFGRATAFEVAKHGTVVLVGRDRENLDALQKAIQQKGGDAVPVVCDLSDVADVRRAAAEIISLNLPLAGLVNNAGIMQMRPTRSTQGLDMSYAANHLGPFVLTEALIPHLPDGANVVFIVSGVEDPERKPAKAAGFRGGRYISAEASARGEWEPGGAKNIGYDAYATSKQCELAALWSSPAKHLASTSMPLSRALLPAPVSGETQTRSSASLRNTFFRHLHLTSSIGVRRS
jgi:NAD(P)-dependent dehydrogenase (short-subunit alcohol dehydrogenase family)